MSDPRSLVRRRGSVLLTLAGVMLVPTVGPAVATAGIDLAAAEVERLDNGLTLIVLEDRTFPVVSVQMLYRVGARDEESGRTGLAHFLEHMAFRASESFPATAVVSSIYAAGGEWHGYTWLDQTTYFETLPREELDLALRIEADRMARLLIPAAEVEAERGAVLAELHGYENDPATVLKDAVLATSFLQHPYRNNSIGWESDVERLGHQDLVDFYRRHYHPANGVLAVVGDVDRAAVRERVEELFGSLPTLPPTPTPRTVEPPQRGERRVALYGGGSRNRFEIAYRAPAVGHSDWPAFLLLQELLGGGEGVNFAQNEWGVPVAEGGALAGVVEDLVTWYPPMGLPYVLTLAGSTAPEMAEEAVESSLEEAIRPLRETTVSAQRLAEARARVLDELLFDVETTEDAAHQLAYFEGLGALDALLALPRALEEVRPEKVRRVASLYLAPHRRTIGWYRSTAEPPAASEPASGTELPTDDQPHAAAPAEPAGEPLPPPLVSSTSSGVPVIVQRSGFSPAAFARVLVPGTGREYPGDAAADDPAWRHTSLSARFRPAELPATLRRLRRALDEAGERPAAAGTSADDPGERLAAAFGDLLGVGAERGQTAPALVALAGDLDPVAALEAVEETFGDLTPPPPPPPPVAPSAGGGEIRVRIAAVKAQARLGYLVPAPPPGDPDHLPWRMLLYVLTHGYEGRLGVEAISRRGLIYYVDSSYPSDGRAAWIGLDIGVDPLKLEPMRELLAATLAGLVSDPPSERELAEAKRHLVGRWSSAAQSNAEITAALAREWIGQGRLRSAEELGREVAAVTREDLLRCVESFTSGTVVVVEVGIAPRNAS